MSNQLTSHNPSSLIVDVVRDLFFAAESIGIMENFLLKGYNAIVEELEQ